MVNLLRLLFVSLLNLLLLLAPVVQASGGNAACLMVLEAAEAGSPGPSMLTEASVHAHASHHGVQHHTDADTSNDTSGNQSVDQTICCTQGCVMDLSAMVAAPVAHPAVVEIPTAWALTNLSDLTAPSGLRRPPKA